MVMMVCFAAPAFAVFDESLDQEQTKKQVIQQRSESEQTYQNILSAPAERSQKLRRRPNTSTNQKKVSRAIKPINKNKDIILGFTAIVIAVMLYVFLIALKRKGKIK